MAQYLDLHIHSMNSPDSFVKPRRIFDKALDLGLSGVAITDHNELTIEPSPFSEVLAIPGMEIFVEDVKADLIALGISRKVPSNLTLKATCDAVHKQGGVVIVPHPFSSSSNYHAIGENIFKISRDIDGIDIMSPKTHVDNRRARTVAEQFRVAKLGGSDAHEEAEIGRAVTVCHRPVFSTRDLINQIKNRQVKAKLLK